MLAEMTSLEFGEWMAFYTLEPFGPLREDLRAGTVAATLVNLKKRKDASAYLPSDFFAELKVEALDEENPVEGAGGITVEAAIAMTQALGGKIVRRSEINQ